MTTAFFHGSLVFFLLSLFPANNFSVAAPVHPFFISVTEMNYNSAVSSIEISCKMFTDDFEQTLKKQYREPVDLAKPKNKKELDKQVFQYLTTHLQMKVNGKPVTLNFVGFETEGESAWVYLEVKNVSTVKSIDLTNSILYENFDSQISIMHAVVAGSRKSTKLVNPQREAQFAF